MAGLWKPTGHHWPRRRALMTLARQMFLSSHRPKAVPPMQAIRTSPPAGAGSVHKRCIGERNINQDAVGESTSSMLVLVLALQAPGRLLESRLSMLSQCQLRGAGHQVGRGYLDVRLAKGNPEPMQSFVTVMLRCYLASAQEA